MEEIRFKKYNFKFTESCENLIDINNNISGYGSIKQTISGYPFKKDIKKLINNTLDNKVKLKCFNNNYICYYNIINNNKKGYYDLVILLI